ncbi:hypothetical protein QTP88_029295 [Uroleucon formosanum]
MASWLFEVSKQFSDQLLSTKDIPPAATVVNLEPMNTLPPLTSTLDIIPSALSSQPLPLLIALPYLIPKILLRQRRGSECLHCSDNCAALAATQPAARARLRVLFTFCSINYRQTREKKTTALTYLNLPFLNLFEQIVCLIFNMQGDWSNAITIKFLEFLEAETAI